MKMPTDRSRISAFLHLLCTIALVLTLSACGGGDEPTPVGSDTAETVGTEPSTETEPPTEEPTEPDTLPVAESDTEPVTEAETEHVAKAPFFLCRFTGDLENGVEAETYDKLDDAISACKKKAYLGLRVCDADGYPVFFPYTELQCDLLREAKWVTDYVRENKFKYGDAPINPAINCDAKKVSCDRLVCWVYYRVGFTDQPKTQGLVVSNFFPWCERMGFEKITRVEDLQPGDLVGVRPSSNGKYPEHVFMYAGTARYGLKAKAGASFLRYDCGSDQRIQSKQPFNEPINQFMLAYRPVGHAGTMTKNSTGVTAKLPLSLACELYALVTNAKWQKADEELTYTYDLLIDGTAYRYASGSGYILNVETGKVIEVDKDTRTDIRTMIRDGFPAA